MFTTSSQWARQHETNRGNQPIEKPVFVNCEQIDKEEWKKRFYAGFPNCEGWAVISVLGPHNTNPSVPGWCINVLKVYGKDQREHAEIFAREEASNYLNVDLLIMQTGKYAPLPPPTGLPTSYADKVMDQHINGYVDRENGDRKKLIENAMKTSEENKKKIAESEKRQTLYLEKSAIEREIDKNTTERIDQPVKRSAFFDTDSSTTSSNEETIKDIDM